ncbi:cytochrome P450 [Actinoplanes sp. GCM10030250]|uniref:cytochrome P450 n=1 Tax=Actinoplanes sp. GCM10030250 TaxID=3273376 RepID=UPI003615D351
MTTPDQARMNASTTALRQLLPSDTVERGGCPFDPPAGLRQRRAQGAVQQLKLANGATAWLILGAEEARAVLGDVRFSSDRLRHPDVTQANTAPPQVESRSDGMFLFMDPPEHTRLRRLLTGQFTVRRMRALESHIRDIAGRHIDAMLAAGTEADLVPAYAMPIPSLVICELLGVDYADRAVFQERTALALNSTTPPEERLRASGELYGFIRELVAAKRTAPGEDLLSGLARDADPPLTDAELVDIALVLLGAGHETTANMLGLSTFLLLENPGQLAALRNDPGLLDNAVEELLRYLSIIQMGVSRVATESITVGETEIPAGSTVIIGTPEVNRDPRLWDDPDQLDVRRDRTSHLAFGHGVHQCLGQQLARVEMKVGLGELFSRLPGLRLAVPAERVPLRDEMLIFGVHSLPVTWA